MSREEAQDLADEIISDFFLILVSFSLALFVAISFAFLFSINKLKKAQLASADLEILNRVTEKKE